MQQGMDGGRADSTEPPRVTAGMSQPGMSLTASNHSLPAPNQSQVWCMARDFPLEASVSLNYDMEPFLNQNMQQHCEEK